MVHEMKLKPIPFDLIKNDQKSIEVRLFDEKRQEVNVGDQIVFSKLPELQEKLTVQVVELLRYKSFEDLFSDNPSVLFGRSDMSVSELSANMLEYYSIEDVQKYGVVGIRISKI